MAKDQEETHGSIVDFAPAAIADIIHVYQYTEERWGRRQAERYDDFLMAFIDNLAIDPTLVPLVPELEDIRSTVAKWKKARHGHRIFFTVIQDGILVVRILHTAQNWTEFFSL